MFTVKSIAVKYITREQGIIIASDPNFEDTYYVCCLELNASQSSGGSSSRLKLLKFKKDQNSQGSYGVDGYGLYGYGGVGSEVIAAVKSVTAFVDTFYTISCDYNNEERSFNIFFYTYISILALIIEFFIILTYY